MLKENTYEKLARANAAAINGLAPKISIWNTGDASAGPAGQADPTAAIRNLFQSLPPLLSTIHEQTGISPPGWIAKMPGDGNGSTGAGGEKKVIGVNGEAKRLNGKGKMLEG